MTRDGWTTLYSCPTIPSSLSLPCLLLPLPQSAQLAQIASTELFQALFFSSHEKADERCVVEGVVYAIHTKGVRVQVPR